MMRRLIVNMTQPQTVLLRRVNRPSFLVKILGGFQCVFIISCVTDMASGTSLTGSDFDASDITWAHAVNSKEELQKALQGDEMFLEADISYGTITGESELQPIMAHPPENTSDISLDQWLKEVLNYKGPQKGVKLDFKTNIALRNAKAVLQTNILPDVLWLNADILQGPVEAASPGVTPEAFFDVCVLFPQSTLSPGWSTNAFSTEEDKFLYSWQDVWLMSRVLACAIDATTPPRQKVTFPVRAVFLKRSVPQLTWLTSVTDQSTLTVWSNKFDFLNVSELLDIRRAFPKSAVYYDLPDNQAEEFLKIKDTVSYEPDPSFDPKLWAILRPNEKPFGCDDATTVSSGTHIVYGGSGKVAVVFNTPLTFPIQIQGRFRPYSLSDYQGNYTCRESSVVLVLANNASYWEGDWKKQDVQNIVLTMGITEADHVYSECWLDWNVTIEKPLQPMIGNYVNGSGACPVDVTFQPNFTLPSDSGVVMGFVFDGPRATVMESVRIKTVKSGNGKSRGNSLLISIVLFSFAVVKLLTTGCVVC